MFFIPIIFYNLSYANNFKHPGRLSSSKYLPASASNKYGKYGSLYSSKDIKSFSGNPSLKYNSESLNNPYTSKAPKFCTKDGEYLGKLSKSQYGPNSANNFSDKYVGKDLTKKLKKPCRRRSYKRRRDRANNSYTANNPKIASK